MIIPGCNSAKKFIFFKIEVETPVGKCERESEF